MGCRVGIRVTRVVSNLLRIPSSTRLSRGTALVVESFLVIDTRRISEYEYSLLKPSSYSFQADLLVRDGKKEEFFLLTDLSWSNFAGWAGIQNGYWAPLFILALVIAT